MANITKRDLVIRISNETGIIQQTVLEVLQKTLDHITAALASGRNVELRKFGAFTVKLRKGRVGRNPKRPGVDVPIPQRAIVKFKAGKEMKAEVTKLSEQLAAKTAADSQPSAE